MPPDRTGTYWRTFTLRNSDHGTETSVHVPPDAIAYMELEIVIELSEYQRRKARLRLCGRINCDCRGIDGCNGALVTIPREIVHTEAGPYAIESTIRHQKTSGISAV